MKISCPFSIHQSAIALVQVTEPHGAKQGRGLIDVDGRSDEIKTGADGYWEECQEFRHKQNGRQFLDAIIVTVVIPEFQDWGSMERLAGYFFEDRKRFPARKRQRHK